MPDRQQVLIFGFGYSARATARAVKDAGGQVIATTRSADTARQIEAGGYQALVADPATPDGAKRLKSAVEHADALVSTVPPTDAGDPILSALSGLDLKAKRPIYLSTTGTYGDRKGGWAFEWEEPAPGQPRSVRRAKAEAAWLAQGGLSFRLGGIYGPGQSALERLRDGKRVVDKPGQIFSRIHVDDIAGAVIEALKKPHVTGAFNLVDDWPSTQLDLMRAASELSGLAMPEVIAYEDADLSPMAESFFSETKRVSNARAKAVLGWRPRYRSAIDALQTMIAS
jgi:nucleoside-diphosphate-sugar epimerase